VAGGRKEVALAAIAVLTAVLGAHGAGPAVSAPMWRRGLRAAGVGVEAAATPSCGVPLMARLALVDALGQLLVRAHEARVPAVAAACGRPVPARFSSGPLGGMACRPALLLCQRRLQALAGAHLCLTLPEPPTAIGHCCRMAAT